MDPLNFRALLMGLVFKCFVLTAWGMELGTPHVEQRGQRMDCPDLGLNIGDACDDGKDNTQNDIVQANCKCQGIDRNDEDLDMDGFTAEIDCDDTNPNINPNMQEIPDNGIDDDCSGGDITQAIDPDADKDGSTLGNGDCDDNDPTVYPGAPEILDNGIDENCNGIVDDITSALEENSLASSFDIFPNPVSVYLQVNFKSRPQEPFQIQIADMVGTVIYHEYIDHLKKPSISINTTRYSNGFYILTVSQYGQQVSKKFMCLN